MNTTKNTVITYGTFDTLHYGHIELLRRAKELTNGGKLIVAISSDNFNKIKGKESHFNFQERKKMLEAIRYVDEIIAEENWEQKTSDVKTYNVDIFVMGDDWKGKFDFISELCKVIYLARTPVISSSKIKALHTSN